MALIHNTQLEQRTRDVKISEDVTFETMLLNKSTLKGLRNIGFHRPSPIQLHGIPLGKCGFDLLLEAKSGTGKTAVFTIITLEKLDLNKALQAIILAPTREIAAQVCDVIKQIGLKYEGLVVEVVMGGLSLEDDIEKLKKRVHIIVGSPGRLKHLIRDGHIDVSSVKILVLDECDKLMEKSFLPDVNYIFSELPIQKQVIMSSATYPENCITFINKYVKSAQHVCPNSNSILVGISQFVTTVPYNNNIVKQTDYKFQELLKILSYHQYKQCLIFCNYVARVTDIHKKLKREAWPAEVLHGQQEQTHRLNTLKSLQEYKCRILISTDLAARGIDASNVDLVINFEPPFEWQTYLHRIGRAGRFGSYGIAVSILSEGKEVNKFKTILRIMKIPIILNNIWTDEKFDIEAIDNDTTQHCKDVKIQDPKNSTPQHSNDITKRLSQVEEKGNENFTSLWNLLIREENKNVQSFENFEELLKSHKAANNSKIETFSDLLQSFQNIQDITCSKEEIIYKCIPMKEYYHKFKMASFNSVTESLLNDNVCINLENNLSTNNFCLNQAELDNSNYSATENNRLNVKDNPTDNVSQKQDVLNDNNYLNKENININLKENEISINERFQQQTEFNDNNYCTKENNYLNLKINDNPTDNVNQQEELNDNNYLYKENLNFNLKENEISINDMFQHQIQFNDNNYSTKENNYLNLNENDIPTDDQLQNQEEELDDNNLYRKENLNKNETTTLSNDCLKNAIIDIKEAERALLEAGLPTSFETMKDKKKKKKSKVICRNMKGNKITDNDINYNLAQSNSIEYDMCKARKPSVNENKTRNVSYKKTLHQRSDNINETKNKKIITTACCNSSECDSHFDYNLWYNQFKSHMKYVEYTLYIEEMCNL